VSVTPPEVIYRPRVGFERTRLVSRTAIFEDWRHVPLASHAALAIVINASIAEDWVTRQYFALRNARIPITFYTHLWGSPYRPIRPKHVWNAVTLKNNLWIDKSTLISIKHYSLSTPTLVNRFLNRAINSIPIAPTTIPPTTEKGNGPLDYYLSWSR